MIRQLTRGCVVTILLSAALFCQDGALRSLLRASEAAWNRGDLAAFASDYEDSPETTFIGREIAKGGAAAILARYRRGYPTRESMGVLSYSEIEVRPLARAVAPATGKYSLNRTPAGGGDASGRFTLILRRTRYGWKIIHDHSS